MVTDAQVRVLRQKRMEGKTMETAAAAAGMGVRTAQKWQRGPVPSETKGPRTWRTRPDPFATVWDAEVVPLLVADTKGVLEAVTLLDVLEERHPGCYGAAQLRTLQRRVRDWRAVQGPGKEVFFQQVHPPGREAQMDFTHATELGVTIRASVLVHMLFEFVLSFSGWTWVMLAFGETFEALSAGLQGALWELGGAPAVGRTDNLSAATHELRLSGGRAFNRRWKTLLEHYDMSPTRIAPGESHQDGVVEQKHHRTKRALEQALVLRGSRDFDSVEAYVAFVREVVAAGNRRVEDKLAAERLHLRPLPSGRVPDFTKVQGTRGALEHHPGRQPDLLGAVATDRPQGRGAAASGPRRG
ncbi:MAG: IS21 family transposase, partial [Myxococcaceae bacterium]|nr:IS21 family transposase [Myxococcaceae bacterium]